MYASNPSFTLLDAPTPKTLVPGTEVTGVNITKGVPEKDFGNETCFDVGLLGTGTIETLPPCMMKLPKAEFSYRLLSVKMK